MATERGDLRGRGRARAVALGLVFALLASACAARPRAAAAPPAAVTAQPADESAAPTDDADDEATPADDDAESTETAEGAVAPGPCPADMALVMIAAPTPARFCVDKYEASLVEVLADGTERPFPHYLPVDGRVVRAVSAPHVFPQGYISEVQAEDACAASSKRLCRFDEWRTACMGPAHTTFPYGAARRPGACNDNGKSAVIAVFGAKAVAASTPAAPAAPASGKHAHAANAANMTKGRPPVTRPRATASKAGGKPASAKASAASAKATKKKGVRAQGAQGKKSARPASVDPGVWARLNDPALGQVEGALGKTGERAECANDFGAFDMMGNLHEWVATDPALPHGTFAGGYYLDTTLNGDGCLYKTQAHAHEYHDYSTGFRCCADASSSLRP